MGSAPAGLHAPFSEAPTEVAERLGRYAEAGLEHPVIMNMTGLVGGLNEAMEQGPKLGELRELLSPDLVRVGVSG